MALSKKFKTNLLVAAGAAIILTEGGMLVHQDKQIDNLVSNIDQSNNMIKELQQDIKAKDKKVEELISENKETQATNKELTTEVEKLKKDNSSLNTKLANEKAKVKATPTAVTTAVSRGMTTRAAANPSQGKAMTMNLSFYGDSAAENGGHAGIDAQGNKLVAGTIASNVYPMGTQFVINGQTFTVRDRGGSHFNSSDRLDIFVPRNSGESDSAYRARILQYGRKTVTAYKL